MSDPPPTFLTIPPEIRLQIYAEVFSPWYEHKPPFGNYPLGITSVCQQVRQESFPLILVDPRHLYSGPSLRELTSSKYLDIISAVTVHVDERTLLEFQKDLLLAPKDIATTVPYSGEWWLATYQSRMSWLPRTRTPERASLNKTLRRSLGIREMPYESPKSIVISTWETLREIQHIKKLKLSFGKADTYPVSTENERRLLLEMISFTCPNIESLTVPTNTSSARLLLTSCNNFHNLQHLNWAGHYTNLIFPKGSFPEINQRFFEFIGNPLRHEALMGGSLGFCVVTIIPPHEYIEAFRTPVPPDHRRMMEFDNH
jgi:hypothetical protein